MDAIEWKNSYCIGIEEIDLQHQHLVSLINEMTAIAKQKGCVDQILDIFNQLADYTEYHFNTEEKYFSSLTDSDRRLHQLQHNHFIEALNQLRHQPIEHDSIEATLFFLTDWLFNHILGEDRKFNAS